MLRPTADRMREALFAILAHRVAGGRVLDLYAGAGTLGLEALSRGAEKAVFVESHLAAARVIAENAATCGFIDRTRVMVMPAARAVRRLERESERFDLVFVDPPYGTGEALARLQDLAARPSLLRAGGLVIYQHARREELPAEVKRLGRMRQADFGETVIDFYQRTEAVCPQ